MRSSWIATRRSQGRSRDLAHREAVSTANPGYSVLEHSTTSLTLYDFTDSCRAVAPSPESYSAIATIIAMVGRRGRRSDEPGEKGRRTRESRPASLRASGAG